MERGGIQGGKTQIEIFFSYAHADETWRNQLEKHLGSLKRQKRMLTWYDRNIPPGAEWASEIDAHLKTADIILLLISSDFIASEYCWSVELEKALQETQRGRSPCHPDYCPPSRLEKDALCQTASLAHRWKTDLHLVRISMKRLLNVVEGIRKGH